LHLAAARAPRLGYGVWKSCGARGDRERRKRRLLDEVDVISAVSESVSRDLLTRFAARKTFDEFETKVLARSFETELAMRILTPTTGSGALGTFASPISSRVYDETVFDRRPSRT